jgi:hypothetical protein
MSSALFEELTPLNSQMVTLNDNVGRVPPEEWLVSTGVRAIGWAVFAFARKHQIRACDVGYSVRAMEAR